MDNPGELDVHRLESLISQIRGVAACKVTTESPGAPEIHVLAASGRSPKEIVRDVESLCLAAFNFRIDHRKVSVAVMRDPGRPRRVGFKSASLEMTGLGLVSVVELSLPTNEEGIDGEKTLTGRSEGSATEVNQQWLVAEAAIAAVNQCASEMFSGVVEFLLEDLVMKDTKAGLVAAVAITMIRGSQERFLLGTSLVRRDINEAVVRSVLDAVNRLLSMCGT